MITKITTALSHINANPKTKKFKILTCPTHEGYQSNLGRLDHEFYLVSGKGIKTWDYHTRPLPQNHFFYDLDINNLRTDTQWDLILSQERFGQFPALINLSQQLGIPLIHLEHTEPVPAWPKKYREQLFAMRGNSHVFITDYNKKSWEGRPEDYVIPHGLDTDLFSNWTGTNVTGLSVVNAFPERDLFCGWNLWKEITGEIQVDLVGHNPGLSESAAGPEALAQEYRSHRFFLNTSQLSPVPLSLLEAMAAGCPVVTTAKQQIPEIVQNGVNGFISNDPEELKKYCKMLVEDYDLAKSIGAAGRKTILEKFSMDQFVSNWNKVFIETYERAR